MFKKNGGWANDESDGFEECFNNKDDGHQSPIQKLIDIRHAFAYPVEDRLKNMQRFDTGINDEQDEGASRNDELHATRNLYPHKFIQQQLCTDIKNNQVRG